MIPLLLLVLSALVAGAAEQKKLTGGHVPAAVTRGHLVPIGNLPATNRLRLAIGLPLRDRSGLNRFIQELYDPASTNYHHFLTSAAFTARFAPTAGDYAQVLAFAAAHHLQATTPAANRMLVSVTGTTADIERAFHIRLKTYRHPREKRNFFAPETEPSVDAGLPVQDVSGLSDYVRPQPCIQLQNRQPGVPQAGSAPGGAYLGADFRQAYVPGTALVGAGQTVGLFQFDGYDPADIAAYATLAGLTNVPLQNVLLEGFDGTPGGHNDEVCLDIEMAMAMAPGLAKIIIYEGNTPNGILNQMAMDNAASQLSCSWGWGGGPTATTEQIFAQMAAQGQSFFSASGDYGAYAPGELDDPSLHYPPLDNPLITSVGGTTLLTDASGNRLAETTWNAGGGFGSGGGYSSYYQIPDWQGGIDLTATGGSPAYRNIPDVALTADNVYITCNSGGIEYVGGTSCAAPLWAGFTALVNEQGAQLGQPPVGWLNPALYNLNRGTNYPAVFNDITRGNNASTANPTGFLAAPGFDLCTGWGTPNGTNLINALTTPAWLAVSGTNVTVTRSVGDAFSPAHWLIGLTNTGANTLAWAAGALPAWLSLTPVGGTLLPAGSTNLDLASLNLALLPPGSYRTALTITNLAQGLVPVAADLAITVNPTIGTLASTGYLGGVCSPANWTISLTNATAEDMNWAAGPLPGWLALTPAAGTLPANGSIDLNLGLAGPPNLPPDQYQALLLITNLTQNSLAFAAFATLALNQSILQNGGFETGDFTGWTLAGDTYTSSTIYNVVATDADYPGLVHSGRYGALLGELGYLATLTQTVATRPGQLYLISGWLNNPVADTNQLFTARWEGHDFLNLTNPPAIYTWTNFTRVVTATGTTAVLQLGAQNDNHYFGLDDVSVNPVPPVNFNSLAVQGNGLSLAWYSLPRLNYEVDYTTDLANPAWTSLGTVTATTNITTLTDTGAPNVDTARFYRLILWP